MNDSTQNAGVGPEAGRDRVRHRSGRIRAARAVYRLFLVVVMACGGGGAQARQTAGQEGGKVAARVNGEPIYERDIARNIRTDLFEDAATELRKAKLEHLIMQVQVRQFLDAHRITVSAQEVDAGVERLRKEPPSLGCPCCRYASLDQFLKLNGITMAEFRVDIRNEVGMGKYIGQLWTKSYPTRRSRMALAAAERKSTQQDFTRGWQIFFNTFQRMDQRADPKRVRAEARAKAEAAWQRLQKGEPFATVARQVSEDQTSKAKGGSLGFVLKAAYGKEFADTLAKLKPGEVSRPFASMYGYHIVKWEPIKDDEVLAICQVDFVTRKMTELLDQIYKSGKIVRY